MLGSSKRGKDLVENGSERQDVGVKRELHLEARRDVSEGELSGATVDIEREEGRGSSHCLGSD